MSYGENVSKLVDIKKGGCEIPENLKNSIKGVTPIPSQGIVRPPIEQIPPNVPPREKSKGDKQR
jgi:hypothetical protein